jgi:hypothetical protein
VRWRSPTPGRGRTSCQAAQRLAVADPRHEGAHRHAMVGLTLLLLSLVGALNLAVSLVIGAGRAVLVSGVLAVVFATVWFGVPAAAPAGFVVTRCRPAAPLDHDPAWRQAPQLFDSSWTVSCSSCPRAGRRPGSGPRGCDRSLPSAARSLRPLGILLQPSSRSHRRSSRSGGCPRRRRRRRRGSRGRRAPASPRPGPDERYQVVFPGRTSATRWCSRRGEEDHTHAG